MLACSFFRTRSSWLLRRQPRIGQDVEGGDGAELVAQDLRDNREDARLGLASRCRRQDDVELQPSRTASTASSCTGRRARHPRSLTTACCRLGCRRKKLDAASPLPIVLTVEPLLAVGVQRHAWRLFSATGSKLLSSERSLVELEVVLLDGIVFGVLVDLVEDVDQFAQKDARGDGDPATEPSRYLLRKRDEECRPLRADPSGWRSCAGKRSRTRRPTSSRAALVEHLAGEPGGRVEVVEGGVQHRSASQSAGSGGEALQPLAELVEETPPYR